MSDADDTPGQPRRNSSPDRYMVRPASPTSTTAADNAKARSAGCMLSLKLTLGTVTAIALLIMGGGTLATTLPVALGALHDIATSHASAVLGNALLQTEAYLNVPSRQVLATRNMTAMPGYVFPTEDPRQVDRWVDHLCVSYIAGEHQLGAAVAWFLDGTLVACWEEQRNPAYYAAYITRFDTGVPVNDGVWFHKSSHTVVPRSDPIYAAGTDISSLDDWRNSSLLSSMLQVTFNGQLPQWGYVQVVARQDPIEFHLAAVTPLRNASGALIGFGTTTVLLDALTSFLQRIDGTAGTEIFTLDAGGYVLASSHPAPYVTSYVAPRNTIAGLGCTSSQSTLDTSSPNVTIACRAHASECAYAPLRQAAAQIDLARADGRAVVRANLDGTVYYVATDRVTTLLRGFPIHILLVMPEEDIIGNVVRGRNIAIGVSAVVFVAAVAALLVLIHVLLAPLTGIARRMEDAAALEDRDTEARDMSSMREIFDLQHAYFNMNTELNRIRSFVPQTVLHNTSVDNDNMDLSVSQLAMSLSGPGFAKSRLGNSMQRSQPLPSSLDPAVTAVPQQHAPAVPPSPQGRLLALSIGLKCETVSVMSVCLSGFHQRFAQLTAEEALAAYEQMIASALLIVRDYGGVIDSIKGDTILATFNAASPCAMHMRRAVGAARLLADAVKAGGFGLETSTGVASGRAHFGNVGTSEMKTFTVVGPAMSQAVLLQRMCALYPGAACLVPQRLFDEVETFHAYAVVDLVRLPGATRPQLVANIVKDFAADAGTEEWLYVVGKEKKALDASVERRNAVFRALAMGDRPRVKELLLQVPIEARDTHDPLMELVRLGDRLGDYNNLASSYGAFFDVMTAAGPDASPGVQSPAVRTPQQAALAAPSALPA